MNRNQKIFASIVIVLVVLFGCGVCYFFINKQSQISETANWRTYTNEKFGYTIKYPNDWAYREYPDTQTGAGFRPINQPNEVQYEFINVGAYGSAENEYNVPFDEYVKEAAITEIQNYEKLNSIKQITTDVGIKAYETTWIYYDMRSKEKGTSLPITYIDYQKTVGSKYKTIQINLGNKDYMKIYDQMISTFKFLH
jgi:hypothetical protein